jgi:hypothetical protein
VILTPGCTIDGLADSKDSALSVSKNCSHSSTKNTLAIGVGRTEVEECDDGFSSNAIPQEGMRAGEVHDVFRA